MEGEAKRTKGIKSLLDTLGVIRMSDGGSRYGGGIRRGCGVTVGSACDGRRISSMHDGGWIIDEGDLIFNDGRELITIGIIGNEGVGRGMVGDGINRRVTTETSRDIAETSRDAIVGNWARRGGGGDEICEEVARGESRCVGIRVRYRMDGKTGVTTARVGISTG